MGRQDYEAVAELLKLALVPAGSTMSKLLGKKVVMSGPVIKNTSMEEWDRLFKCPCVVAGTRMDREEKRCFQLFIMDEKLAGYAADLVMGNDGPHTAIDEIALGTLKEVIAQSIEASRETIREFVGEEVNEELLGLRRMESVRQMKDWCLEAQMKDFLLAVWEMEIGEEISGTLFGIVTTGMPEVMGIPVEGASNPQEGSYGKRKGRMIRVREAVFPEMKAEPAISGAADIDPGRESIQDMTLGVAVEIGSVECTVQDVLNLEEGRVLMLDKQAGSSADIVVNGQLVAKGDIMVVGERFAARITEIVNRKG